MVFGDSRCLFVVFCSSWSFLVVQGSYFGSRWIWCFLVVHNWSWWFLMILGGSWWFLVFFSVVFMVFNGS